jgi:MerR family transcriptional regulator, light-induced transcriptional regulator
MYTISRAAELTGVPVATLRAWERRYAVVRPLRTEGGYRLYDDGALATIRLMSELVDGGWSPRQAAVEVLRRGEVPRDPDSPAAQDSPPPGAVPAEGRLLGRPPAATAGFVDAARAMDTSALTAILDERFGRGSFESVVDEWLMPALRAIGDAWAAGELSTAAEHLAANTVHRRLATAFEAAAHSALGPHILVGLAPGCRHELGALAFATAARRAGLTVSYLGSDLPVQSWIDAVRQDAPSAVVLAAPRRRDVAAVARVADAVRAADPGVVVGVGGGFQEAVPPPARALGHRMGDAARRLAEELSAV